MAFGGLPDVINDERTVLSSGRNATSLKAMGNRGILDDGRKHFVQAFILE